jgi:5,10-methylenetetrahydromethanopterin reductase
MRSSIRINNDLTFEDLLALTLAAEDAGIDQIWVSNDLMLRSAPVIIGALAARTTQIRLGISIMNPYTVHPTEIAMIAATLQELSDNRFLLGVGAGAEEFLRWAGLERVRPLTATRQAVAALRKLLGHSDVVDADLPPWWNDDARLRVPVRVPVPVYVGAMGPKMRRMAGEIADGALPLLFPPESFPGARSDVDAGLTEAGRDRNRFDLPACVWVSVGDGTPARRALAEKLAYYGSSISPVQLAAAGLSVEDLEPAARSAFNGDLDGATALLPERAMTLGIAGSVDHVVDRCRRLAALGVDHLSFGPPLGPDPVSAVRLLGMQVLPALR